MENVRLLHVMHGFPPSMKEWAEAILAEWDRCEKLHLKPFASLSSKERAWALIHFGFEHSTTVRDVLYGRERRMILNRDQAKGESPPDLLEERDPTMQEYEQAIESLRNSLDFSDKEVAKEVEWCRSAIDKAIKRQGDERSLKAILDVDGILRRPTPGDAPNDERLGLVALGRSAPLMLIYNLLIDRPEWLHDVPMPIGRLRTLFPNNGIFQKVLVCCANKPGEMILLDEFYGAVWTKTPILKAKGNLQNAVSKINKVIKGHGWEISPLPSKKNCLGYAIKPSNFVETLG